MTARVCQSLIVLLILSAHAHAQSDPTFGGLARKVHCSMSTMVACEGNDWCVVGRTGMLGPGANLWISLSQLWVSPSSLRRESVPISIQSVSPAVLNRELNVKFTFKGSNGAMTNGLLFFSPRGNGGYSIVYGGTLAGEKSGKRDFELNKTIVGGVCEIQNDVGD